MPLTFRSLARRTNHQMTTAIAIGVLATVSHLPSLAHAQRSPQSSQIQRRFAADSFWAPLWSRGGSKEPDLLSEPRHVVVTHGVVVVLEEGTREVMGFDALTGVSRFTKQATGVGPGEFRRPARIVATPTGFGVLDHASARLTVFDSAARFAWDAVIQDAISTDGLCVRRGGVLTKVGGGVKSVLATDSTGKLQSRRSIDSLATEDADFAWVARVVGPDSRGNCAIVRLFGAGWYLVAPNGALTLFPYVEGSPLPKVTTTILKKERVGSKTVYETQSNTNDVPAVADAMVVGDTLIVRARSSGKNLLRMLDYYELPSGRYIHSRRLPSIATSLAAAPAGVFYATVFGGDENSSLFAFKTSATPIKRSPPSAVKKP